MNISSLIKVFGIAAAGFVPQAQANPFGISFVKVDPPKDKKEEAICFRLKLSQTDVFSEHNFTDITFRPDTTVFLQKNMVIEDEEEVLKKTFKNFNAEKDPFEIPDKYLPLEDKDRAEWVDKDGKPLKFLVVVVPSQKFTYGYAHLAVSGYPKQSVFSSPERVQFLDGVDCLVGSWLFTPNDVERVGLHNKGKIQCFIGGVFERWYHRCRVIFNGCDDGVIYALHVPSGFWFSGKVGSFSVRCPLYVVGSTVLDYIYPEGSGARKREEITNIPEAFEGDVIAITRWDSSKVRSCCNPEIHVNEEKGIAWRIERGDFRLNMQLYHNVRGKDSFSISNKEKVYDGNTKECVDVNYFVFFLSKEQPNK